MKRLHSVAAASLFALVAGCAHGPMPGSGDGWVTLFDGSSLEAFDKVGDANWKLADGLVSADHGSGFLVTKKDYKDFRIRVEFWAESDTNSGVFLRCADPKKPTSDVCYEVNIWDMRPVQDYATGAIVDVAKVSPVPKAGGHWNTYDITAQGDHLTVVLNGVKTAEARNAKHAHGPIGLQRFPGVNKTAPTTIKFRKVQIREL